MKKKVYPWARAYKIALEDENVVLFSTTHTKERDDKFKWVGPLATKRDILIARKASGIKINTLDDAKSVGRIGTLKDDTREIFLKSYGFENLEPVSDEQLNARKLVLGRIDLWAYKIPGLRTVCDLAGVDHNELEEVYHLRKIDVGIAFSKKHQIQTYLKLFYDHSGISVLKIGQHQRLRCQSQGAIRAQPGMAAVCRSCRYPEVKGAAGLPLFIFPQPDWFSFDSFFPPR